MIQFNRFIMLSREPLSLFWFYYHLYALVCKIWSQFPQITFDPVVYLDFWIFPAWFLSYSRLKIDWMGRLQRCSSIYQHFTNFSFFFIPTCTHAQSIFINFSSIFTLFPTHHPLEFSQYSSSTPNRSPHNISQRSTFSSSNSLPLLDNNLTRSKHRDRYLISVTFFVFSPCL